MSAATWIAAGALARHEFRRCLTPARWIPTILIVLAPLVLMALALPHVKRPERAFFYFTTIFYLRLVPMGVALIHALQASTGELNEATGTYVFSGALRRWLIFVVKAGVVSAFIAAHLAAGLGGAALLLSPEEGGVPAANAAWMSLWAAAAAAIWTAYFLACGYAFRRPMAFSLGLALIFEFTMSGLPFDIASYTVYQSLRALARETVLVAGALPGRWLWAPGANRAEFLEGGEAGLYLSILYAALVAAGVLVISRRAVAGRPAAE